MSLPIYHMCTTNCPIPGYLSFVHPLHESLA